MTRFPFIRRRLLAPPPHGLSAIAYACLAVAVPTAIRASIDGVVSGTTFVAYYPFVLLTAMFVDWQYALAAATVSAALANFLFQQPRYMFFASLSDTAGALSFLLSSALMIALADALRRTVEEVERSRKNEAHLNCELQHRVKNNVAVIQGLATQTFRDPQTESDLRKFQGRLQALAGANDVLRGDRWDGCRLPELAVRALEPFNREGCIHLYGPPCALKEESCIPLVLALHELATNAVKYGALSTPIGKVEVLWAISGGDGPYDQDLILEWTERDGPEVQPPTRRGLGARLLRSQRGLDDVQLAFHRHGVSCRFHLAGAEGLTAES